MPTKPTGKPRGRPRAPEPGSTVSVHLPASEHDRVIQLAKQHEQTISRYVRTLLQLRLPAKSG